MPRVPCNAITTSFCFLIFGIPLAARSLRAEEQREQEASKSSPVQQPWEADPALVEKLTNRKSEFNYQEASVPSFSLPDVLAGQNGTRVESSKDWESFARPRLLNLFRSEVYGIRPMVKPAIEYQVLESESAFGDQATGYQVRATIRHNDKVHSFEFVLFTPKRSQPAPILVQINNRYLINMKDALKKDDPFWPAKKIVERGYATATFHTSDVDPDKADGYLDGVRALLDDPDADPSARWRSLSAWGWAASRVLDYASTLNEIDVSKSAVIGHSRGGKAALWAAAEDARFAIAYSNNSGCGGAALSRRRFGETVARITTVFPHWFTDRFAGYANREDELPVDQHQLIALIAPRSVYVTSADQDLWADPRGEYLSLVGASEAFELYGQESITNPEMPVLDQPRRKGPTGYHIRGGKHNLIESDWMHFLDFADQRFRKK
ncbi:MAG: acetylxylan esterase [Planctomycetota bacterium]